MDPSFLAHQLPHLIDRIEGALNFLNVISFSESSLMNGLIIQAPPVLWRDRPLFLHNFQNASCIYSSNSNRGKVSSHSLLYLLIPDSDLDGSFEVELEQYFLGGLGCTLISDSLPSSESLELETTEDLDVLLKYKWISIFKFCFSVLQFIYR